MSFSFLQRVSGTFFSFKPWAVTYIFRRHFIIKPQTSKFPSNHIPFRLFVVNNTRIIPSSNPISTKNRQLPWPQPTSNQQPATSNQRLIQVYFRFLGVIYNYTLF